MYVRQDTQLNKRTGIKLDVLTFQVYLLLWFWMFGLTILTFVHLLFRLLTIALPPIRRLLIILKIRGFSTSDMATCKSVLSHCYLGDWFVLYQLSKNSNTYFFRYLLKIMDSSFTSQVRNKEEPIKQTIIFEFFRQNLDISAYQDLISHHPLQNHQMSTRNVNRMVEVKMIHIYKI